MLLIVMQVKQLSNSRNRIVAVVTGVQQEPRYEGTAYSAAHVCSRA